MMLPTARPICLCSLGSNLVKVAFWCLDDTLSGHNTCTGYRYTAALRTPLTAIHLIHIKPSKTYASLPGKNGPGASYTTPPTQIISKQKKHGTNRGKTYRDPGLDPVALSRPFLSCFGLGTGGCNVD